MANLNSALSPAPVVQCLTTGGEVATGYTSNVTMSLAVNPTGATLGGTLTVAATAGVSTFSNLTLNRSGKGFVLQATGPAARTRRSEPFDIPTRCVFTTEPSVVDLNTNFTCVVTVRDGANATDTGYNGNITLSLYKNSNNATLNGTLTKAAISGVATFNDLQLDQTGTYSIFARASEVATAYPPSAAVTSDFIVSEFALEITADTQDYNVYNAFVAQYGLPPADATVSVLVYPGVYVTASDTSSAAMVFSELWPANPTFFLANLGFIYGKGGNAGGNGGPGLDKNSNAVTIVIGEENILGGGGGGGNGGSATPIVDGGVGLVSSGGAGGGGAPFGQGGTTGATTPPGFLCTGPAQPSYSTSAGTNGGNATLLVPGTGGNGSSGSASACPIGEGNQTPFSSSGGNGGSGGGVGQNGVAGSSGNVSPGGVTPAGTAGGLAGDAIIN